VLSGLIITATGCTPEAGRFIRFPSLFHPGPAGYQRAEAVVHDPYPLNDVGPEIEGGRPLEYLQPVPEVVRAQMAAPRPIGVQPPPFPVLPAGPPPIVTAPVVTAPAPVAPYQPPIFQQRAPY